MSIILIIIFFSIMFFTVLVMSCFALKEEIKSFKRNLTRRHMILALLFMLCMGLLIILAMGTPLVLIAPLSYIVGCGMGHCIVYIDEKYLEK